MVVVIQTPTFHCYILKGILYLEWYKDAKLHRINGPAKIEYSESGKIRKEQYYEDGNAHRIDEPAEINYHESGQIQMKCYYKDGTKNRTDGPALIWYSESGKHILLQE